MPSIRPLDSYDYKNDGVDLNFLNGNSTNNEKNYLNFSDRLTVSNCPVMTTTTPETILKKRDSKQLKKQDERKNRLQETLQNVYFKDDQGTLIDLRNIDQKDKETVVKN